jgi:hypothetical protein
MDVGIIPINLLLPSLKAVSFPRVSMEDGIETANEGIVPVN